MKRIIVHVGPGKCGSSSIQSALLRRQETLAPRVKFAIVSPAEISRLNRDKPDEGDIARFADFLAQSIAPAEILILSHEVLFQARRALEVIVRLASGLTADVAVIGYSRRQSDFSRSGYCQWHFRSPDRSRETCETLVAMGLDPVMFSGLERHLISVIETNLHTARQLSGVSILNWHDGYREIADRLADLDVKIAAGFIPTKKYPFSLLQDFCSKCGIASDGDWRQSDQTEVANRQFNIDLVEAFAAAVMHKLPMPGPHMYNEFFPSMARFADTEPVQDTPFVSDLKAGIDTMCFDMNSKFAQKFGLPVDYFLPEKDIQVAEMKGIIADEHKKRMANPRSVIERESRLTANIFKSMFDAYLERKNAPE